MAKGLQDLADIAFRPEDDPVFRQAQLLLLLDELRSEPTSLDRLTYYDFFAESPYLLFTEEDPERRTLRLAGFQSAALSYHSPAQRFVTRQEQVGGDLAITAYGSKLSQQLRAMYSDAYRTSAQLVFKRLRRLSNKRLHEDARGMLDPDDDQLWTLVSKVGDSS